MGKHIRSYIDAEYLEKYIQLVTLFPDKEEYLEAANQIGISPQIMMVNLSGNNFLWYAKEIKRMRMEGHGYIPAIMQETEYIHYKIPLH